jgi:hypothetical protein
VSCTIPEAVKHSQTVRVVSPNSIVAKAGVRPKSWIWLGCCVWVLDMVAVLCLGSGGVCVCVKGPPDVSGVCMGGAASALAWKRHMGCSVCCSIVKTAVARSCGSCSHRVKAVPSVQGAVLLNDGIVNTGLVGGKT